MKTLHSTGVKGLLLPPAVPIHVQCEGFRCLAYRDETGAWRSYPTKRLLSGKVRPIEYGEGLEKQN